MDIHDDNPQHHTPAIYYQSAEAPKWIATILTSLGATLVGALLLWIASSQLSVSRDIAVLANSMEAMREQQVADGIERAQELDYITGRFDRIWPRIRANNTNITILHRKLEELCDCEVQLSDPEAF